MLNTFLTEVLLIAGLGAFLDNVFINKEERQKIEVYLESGPKDLALNVRFSRFLERAHSIIFARFFSGRLLSFSFLFPAALISIVSFSAVLGVQIYFFPEQFSQIRYDATQYGIFAAFIAFNILFDYATIIQTKIFIEASLTANSIVRAVVFIGSDLIVTMNTFILSYAFFILLAVQVFVADTKTASIILLDATEAQTIDPGTQKSFLSEYDGRAFVDRIRFNGRISGALMPNRDQGQARQTVVFYYSTFDPQAAQIQAAILANLTNLNLTDMDVEEVQEEQTVREYYDTLLGTRSELERALDGDVEGGTLYLLTFGVDGSVVRNGSLEAAYTASFYLADQLEDAFPISLLGPMELPTLNSLIEDAVGTPIPNLPTVICFDNNSPVGRFQISQVNANLLERCSDFILFQPIWQGSFDKDLTLVGRDTDGYRVPFNTLLITSILPTAFFYMAIMLLAIATVFYSKLIKGTKRMKKFFLRAPLAISGFILGAVLSLTGVI